MMSDDTVPQQIAVITGASSGIGAAFAREVVRDGYFPVLVAVDQKELDAVAGQIAEDGGVRARTLAMDLSLPGAVKHLLDLLHTEALVPHLLINNAGFGLMGKSTSLTPEDQISMINLNITALTELSLRCGKIMAGKGGGGIINLSSVAGTLPGPNMAVYYASKAYILSFSEALWEELRGNGVCVTAVAPGVTDTAFHKRAGMERSRLVKWSAPMSAEAVARIGYQGHLRGRRVVTTGILNKLSSLCTRFIPNAILLRVMSQLHRLPTGETREVKQTRFGEKVDT